MKTPRGNTESQQLAEAVTVVEVPPLEG